MALIRLPFGHPPSPRGKARVLSGPVGATLAAARLRVVGDAAPGGNELRRYPFISPAETGKSCTKACNRRKKVPQIRKDFAEADLRQQFPELIVKNIWLI